MVVNIFTKAAFTMGWAKNYVTLKQKIANGLSLSLLKIKKENKYIKQDFQKINNDETNTSDIPYEEIIQNQQNIIETMTIQLKQSADTIYKMKQNETKYIKIIQQLKENKS